MALEPKSCSWPRHKRMPQCLQTMCESLKQGPPGQMIYSGELWQSLHVTRNVKS